MPQPMLEMLHPILYETVIKKHPIRSMTNQPISQILQNCAVLTYICTSHLQADGHTAKDFVDYQLETLTLLRMELQGQGSSFVTFRVHLITGCIKKD